MGNYISAQDRAAKARSDAIDRQLEKDSRKLRNECKVLLLGSRESGKSTIVRHMSIVHHGGLTDEELTTYRTTIYHNTLDSAQSIVLAMRKIGYDYVDPANCVNADRILDYRIDPSPAFVFSSTVAQAIYQLWKDPIIPKVMDRASEFYLMDNAVYFLTDVLRIGSPTYRPTENDVLQARLKTTGITETKFAMGQLEINIIDVSRQFSERRKWIHCFESVTSIIFCVDMSEYDQVLLEEKNQNRMAESLVLFESVINSRWFLRTSIILFLNNIDVFKTKLPKVPLEKYFPEYSGGAGVNKAARYMLWRFMQVNRARLSVYPHMTQATDTTNIRFVFAAVEETIRQKSQDF